MTEFELIEISRRRRLLEETIEDARRVLGLRHDSMGSDVHVELSELIDDLEQCAEQCRDDMVAMQKCIRQVAK